MGRCVHEEVEEGSWCDHLTWNREEIENCIDDADVTMTQVMNKGKGFIIEV